VLNDNEEQEINLSKIKEIKGANLRNRKISIDRHARFNREMEKGK